MKILFGIMGGAIVFVIYCAFGLMTMDYKFNHMLEKAMGFVFIGLLVLGGIIGALM